MRYDTKNGCVADYIRYGFRAGALSSAERIPLGVAINIASIYSLDKTNVIEKNQLHGAFSKCKGRADFNGRNLKRGTVRCLPFSVTHFRSSLSPETMAQTNLNQLEWGLAS